jgi:ribosomal protein S18 acetylase RimI-like enzyme
MNPRPSWARLTAAPVGVVALVLVLALPAVSSASNASLKRTLTTWSNRIAADARGISLSAIRRHPRRMMLRANHFRRDALSARRALAAQRPSTARGWRARALALAAFRDYAVVGREWSLAGQARLRHRRALATRYAAIAKRYAAKGNRLLVAAGRLLR